MVGPNSDRSRNLYSVTHSFSIIIFLLKKKSISSKICVFTPYPSMMLAHNSLFLYADHIPKPPYGNLPPPLFHKFPI